MALAGVVAGTIVVFYFVFISSTKPNMVVAYSGLEPEDSAQIADELERLGIPYEVGAGGSSVSVAANQVAEIRIDLAQAGLPSGGNVGFEIFDKTNFGATDFTQQVNFRRATEGELARSINTLSGVRSSRVHIVMPQEAIFQEDQVAASASIVLGLQAGASVTQDQVKGIGNLVSGAVEGLELSGVTIIDSSGSVLFDGSLLDSPFSVGGTTGQLELKRQFERALEADIQTILAPVVGVGRSAVTVNADMDFDSVTSEASTFGDPLVRSQVTTNESFTGAGAAAAAAVPGTGANGDNPSSTSVDGNDSTYTSTQSTVNNELPQTITTTVQAPGRVKRLSVSVVLDESITGAQETALTTAVAAAVGFDAVRGDTLSVTRLPFDVATQESLVPIVAGDGIAQYLDYLKLVLPLLAVVLAFVLVSLLLRSLGKKQLALPATGPMVSVPAVEAAAASQVAPAPRKQELLPELEQSNPQEERIVRMAQSNPRAVAQVVQTWMREEG
jgi:flagellar M-ring protein FliF